MICTVFVKLNELLSSVIWSPELISTWPIAVAGNFSITTSPTEPSGG